MRVKSKHAPAAEEDADEGGEDEQVEDDDERAIKVKVSTHKLLFSLSNTVHPGTLEGQLDWTRLADDEWSSGGIIDNMMADI